MKLHSFLHRLTGAAGIGVIVGLLGISTVSADPATVTRTAITTAGGNPCTDTINGTGFRQQVHVSTGPGIVSHSNTHLMGVDPSGQRYNVVMVSTSVNQDFPGDPRYINTSADNMHVVGAGDAPDFHANFKYHVTLPPAGEPVVEHTLDKISCSLW